MLQQVKSQGLRASLRDQFQRTRDASLLLAQQFSRDDWMVQSMEEASPIKWNLAHTSWFYETFILQPHNSDYVCFDASFGYLFNSYYQQVGAMHPRPFRGMISRPSADEVVDYRRHVDAATEALIDTASSALLETLAPLFDMGAAHEEQHQELMLTDIKHALFQNPTAPAAVSFKSAPVAVATPPMRRSDRAPARDDEDWAYFDGGVYEIGHRGDSFAFDNEGPRHKTYLAPYGLARRPVSNRDYCAFIEAGGYETSSLWLADGWALATAENWRAPLYWSEAQSGGWCEYTLAGVRPLDLDAPVAHLSYYEAAAFAEWTGFRLPTEFEWERASHNVALRGDFLQGANIIPPRGVNNSHDALQQMFGGVWEWTASPYVAYPGYRAVEGAIGEYNGKFMSSQMVLRGGSCATPAAHMRRTYRNFFPPNARWQFAGLRLARDV